MDDVNKEVGRGGNVWELKVKERNKEMGFSQSTYSLPLFFLFSYSPVLKYPQIKYVRYKD